VVRFNLSKLSELEVRKQDQIKTSYRFAALQNLNDSGTINRAWENTKKGKANPLQALTGPEGSRRLRLPDFKTIGT
jgi:hypothetical protein